MPFQTTQDNYGSNEQPDLLLALKRARWQSDRNRYLDHGSLNFAHSFIAQKEALSSNLGSCHGSDMQ